MDRLRRNLEEAEVDPSLLEGVASRMTASLTLTTAVALRWAASSRRRSPRDRRRISTTSVPRGEGEEERQEDLNNLLIVTSDATGGSNLQVFGSSSRCSTVPMVRSRLAVPGFRVHPGILLDILLQLRSCSNVSFRTAPRVSPSFSSRAPISSARATIGVSSRGARPSLPAMPPVLAGGAPTLLTPPVLPKDSATGAIVDRHRPLRALSVWNSRCLQIRPSGHAGRGTFFHERRPRVAR